MIIFLKKHQTSYYAYIQIPGGDCTKLLINSGAERIEIVLSQMLLTFSNLNAFLNRSASWRQIHVSPCWYFIKLYMLKIWNKLIIWFIKAIQTILSPWQKEIFVQKPKLDVFSLILPVLNILFPPKVLFVLYLHHILFLVVFVHFSELCLLNWKLLPEITTLQHC